MASDHRPRRQLSNASSETSSGTIRAGSGSGRRRSFTSSHNGIFARLTGKGREKTQSEEVSDQDDDGPSGSDGGYSSPTPPPGWRSRSLNRKDANSENGGPRDEYRRSPSPISMNDMSASDTPQPPTNWRNLSTHSDHLDDPESGPSDYWQRPSPKLLPTITPIDSHSVSSSDFKDVDDDEYHRRLSGLRSIELAVSDGARPNAIEVKEGGYFDWRTPDTPDSATGRNAGGYDQAYRSIISDEKWGGIGEEEFGAPFQGRDDASDKSASISSVSMNGSTDNRRLAPARLYPTNKAISRLRSHLRTTSSATQQSASAQVPPGLGHMRSASHFSQISRTDSVSTMSGLERVKSPPHDPTKAKMDSSPAFNFHPLRHLSAHLFSKQTSGSASPLRLIPGTASASLGDRQSLGRPTVMDVRGMIAVGTERGWVVVYSFAQELRYVLGNDTTASSPVTAVTICPDQTYIAVGHASGNIHLFDLSSPPTKPARTTLALPLSQLLSGRKEGHLKNSRILHIGFVGKRHTSIVTGDEHGRAFWWSLGKVIGVESNDVVRMLGSYPDDPGKAASPRSKATKRATTLFSLLPLPLGEQPHSTDALNFTAMLTPVKLVIVGMKPAAKTWYRKMRETAGGNEGGLVGCASWLRSGELSDPAASDPVLAYSWGRAVRFLRIKVSALDPKDVGTPEFVDGRKWEAPNPVQALHWYDSNHVLLITTIQAILLDVRSMKVVEDTPLQTKLLTAHDFHSSLRSGMDSVKGSVQSYRGKLFLLTKTNLQVGSLLHWNDRVLSKVHQGDFLGAIQLALAYYEDRAAGNLINLPDDSYSRRQIIGGRVRELMKASLEWAFSDERMKDDTHFSADGRGVDLTGLFEGLANTCIEACLSMDDQALLFDEVYEHFSNAGIQAILLSHLESYLFEGRLSDLPPNVVQALIGMHDDRGEFDSAEAVIWHVDPSVLDINQAINICENHGLWDAMIHVYTRALRDYVAPIVKLLGLVGEVRKRRRDRPSLVEENDVAENAPDAYKLYAYIENVLSGLSYPSGETLPESESFSARSETYGFIFQGSAVSWPPGGDLVLTDENVAYPYLHLLLRFDTEAFLHAMDIAFENPYLNDTAAAINRQSIVNLMLEVMDDTFPSSDVTFLHIFVARNLPKYPQFLFIPPSTLHRILVSLASDQDQSTREDRQLAAEFLLSAYTPHDSDAMMQRFERAGFFRILRSTYRREQKWAALISTYLNDPETDEEAFAHIDEILQQSKSPQTTRTISDALPHLFDLSVRQTALLLDKDLPSLHTRAIQTLSSTSHKQMVYLKCLLEPSMDDEDVGPLAMRNAPSTSLDTDAKHLYVKLLCQQDPSAVVTFLDARGSSFFDLPRLAEECRKASIYEGQLWALDRQGKTVETFEVVRDILSGAGPDLGQALVAGDEGGIHVALQAVDSVTKMAVRLCQEHCSTPDVEDLWYGVLDQIVQLNNSIVSLGTTNDSTALDTLRGLIQSTLSALVSSSSPSLSFPRLFKRLVESSTSSSKAIKKGRAYAEFRTILMGMLDSYKAEGDLLGMTIRLVEADLFGDVEEMTIKRMRGWRPSASGLCASCGKELVAESGGALLVLGSGEVRHQSCSSKA